MTVRSVAHGMFGFMTSWGRFLSVLPWLFGGLLGMTTAWGIINYGDNPGVQISGQAEAEGAEFSDINTLDLVSFVSRKRACPATATRYVWRWVTYDGKRMQQIIPLMNTDVPFLPEAEGLIVSLPTANVPDKESGEWFERTNVSEQCGVLPTFVGRFFGTPQITKGPNIAVNFRGLPH